MAEMIGSIEYEVVETEEEPFRPGVKAVEVVMYPAPGEEPYYPPTTPLRPVPSYTEIPAKPLIVDVETTGAMPFNSRIICIGVLDPKQPNKPIVFFDMDEEKVVKDFVDYFRSGMYNMIIGYNLNFDLRFIFAKCLRYRIKFPELTTSDWLDLMIIMRQVKQRGVISYNKPGTLGEWSEYLFGIVKKYKAKDVVDLWKKKAYEEIIKHNREDLDILFKLLSTINYVLVE